MDAPVAAVAAEVAGQVASVEVREGQRVSQGQVLARLDAREKQAAVAVAEANLAHARQAVAEAREELGATAPDVQTAGAAVAVEQAALDKARRDFERARQLFARGVANQSELDAARTTLEQARAAVSGRVAGTTASRGRVSAAEAKVATAEAALAASEAEVRLAQTQLAQAEVRSPFAGLVVSQNLRPGEWAAAGTPVVTVEETGRRWVRLDVPETHLGAWQVGRGGEIRVLGLGRTYPGRVIEVGALGDFALNRDVKRGRPDIRTFRVRVAFERAPGADIEALRPGMTAEVTPAP